MFNSIKSSRDFTSSNTLTFNCTRDSYLLVDVEFTRVRLPLSNDSFHKFVDACPNLQKVKFDLCEGIHLYHILYLLNHATALKSINVDFHYSVSEVENLYVDEIGINTTLKSLVLQHFGTFSNETFPHAVVHLLSIFKKCPMVKVVVVDFYNIPHNVFSVVAWCEMIAINWQLVQYLTLINAGWMVNNELIMNALGSCCGKTLKELSVDGEVTNALIARICQSFVALESLELLFDDRAIMHYPTMLHFLQQARFRNTLHRLKVPFKGRTTFEEPFNYSDILNCFPALHTIDLMMTKDLYVDESFACIPQLKECTFRFSALKICLLPSVMKNMMKDFINLKKLTLHNLLLDSTSLSIILTLPKLEHLIFHNVYEHDGTNNHPLLHPNQYPSNQLLIIVR